MDVPLYAIALGVFGALYLVLGVFLIFALMLSLLAMYLYLVLRFGKLPDDYPHGTSDALVTAIFIGVTWGIFTLLGPKNPIPFVGNGLTYTAATFPIGGIIAVTLILLLAFIVIGAFIVPRLQDRGRAAIATGSSGTTVQQQQGGP